jgi:outer membrane receptor protein involved in Fe transport
MPCALWIALALAAAPLSQRSTELKGQVLFQDGTPVVDAEVSVLGRPGSARTDGEGRFSWIPAPAVPFEVLVVLPGGRFMAPVLVERRPEGDVLVIRIAPLVEESVSVTASAAPNIESTPASGMSLIPRDEIVARQPARLTEVIESIPGVSHLSEGHVATPSIRGLARGRTLILIDGARVTTERRTGPSATYLDPFFLEGVEVARGPGSVAYGSDAFGGVIHARTRRAEPGGLPEKSVGLELSKGLSQGGLLFQARHRDFDDWRSAEGEVFNSAAEDSGFLGRFDHEVGRGRLLLGWQSDLGRDIGRPRNNSRDLRVENPREDSHRFTASYRMDPRWGFTQIAFNGFLGSYRLLTVQDRTPSATRPRQIESADVSASDFGLRISAMRPVKRARLEFGLDLNGRFSLQALDGIERFDAAGNSIATSESTSIENASRTDTGLYLSGELLATSCLTLGGGLRFDHVGTRNQGGFFGDLTTSHDAASGFASATVTLSPGLALTGQLARGFRDPFVSDRYFRGVSGRGFITGNPLLEPETSRQLDLALRYTRQGFRGALYAYHYRLDDLIERYEPEPDLFFFRNRGRARLRGIEIELGGEAPYGLTLELGGQLARGLALDEGEPLDDVPVQNLTLTVKKALRERGYLQIRGALFARDSRPGPTEKVTPGYGIIDLAGGWRLNSIAELRVSVRNLLDKDYPASPDERAVLAPGIAGLLTVLLSF